MSDERHDGVSTNEPAPLLELLFQRLAADDVPARTAEVILAALCGEDDLAAALAGGQAKLDLRRTGTTEPRSHIYMSSVAVAGFRGVGPERTLALHPGPGLTLVVGRNGSGKSSFAEAIELSLTGDSARWADKNSVWRTGWRNLHAPNPCVISTELRVDGVPTATRVRRSWPADCTLIDADVLVTSAEGRFTNLASLGLARPLELYRPFLTAADLGRLIGGTATQLFDAIDTILGLDGLTDADKRLMAAARHHDARIKEVRAGRENLRGQLGDIDDDRARRAVAILASSKPDLDQLDAILAEPLAAGPDPTIALARRLAALTISDSDDIRRLADELRTAVAEAGLHDESRANTSVRIAEMLRLALDHHADSGDGPCPVCQTGALNAGWRATATGSLNELRASTLAARRAAAHLTDLIRRVRGVVDGIEVPDGEAPDVPTTDLRRALAMLREVPGSPRDLADHLTDRYPDVAKAAAEVRAAAATWLRQRDSAWRQAADGVRLWIAAARQVPEHEHALALLKGARAWLKSSGEKIRNERVAPFAEHSQRIWRQLRQESNVELGAMTLAGTSTRRRVVFPVSVDGVDNGTALGVMSQGELHALGLATFLPRSCAPESPFRFIVIDDPVQSMDPAKVDGLARVLGRLAEDRQIIVFTHDSRLPDAVRRLELNARVLEVLRAEQSVVTLRPAMDPIRRYLDDANAVALSEDVPEDVRAPVVAELCRSALEAACHRVVWRVRAARGERYTDIEAAIDKAGTSITTLFALALFDDPERGKDVLGRLANKYGPHAVEAFNACRRGVHGGYLRDLPQLVTDTRILTRALT
ncbi:MAG TPA: AAA family ATPase [Kribbellaceae bacterium]|nr:AAA family ATPase [Kribbellaceae bacterium]